MFQKLHTNQGMSNFTKLLTTNCLHINAQIHWIVWLMQIYPSFVNLYCYKIVILWKCIIHRKFFWNLTFMLLLQRSSFHCGNSFSEIAKDFPKQENLPAYDSSRLPHSSFHPLVFVFVSCISWQISKLKIWTNTAGKSANMAV